CVELSDSVNRFGGERLHYHCIYHGTKFWHKGRRLAGPQSAEDRSAEPVIFRDEYGIFEHHWVHQPGLILYIHVLCLVEGKAKRHANPPQLLRRECRVTSDNSRPQFIHRRLCKPTYVVAGSSRETLIHNSTLIFLGLPHLLGHLPHLEEQKHQ